MLANAWVTLALRWLTAQRLRCRDRGEKLLTEVSDAFLRRGYNLCELPIINVYLARHRARRGNRDDANLSCAPPSTIWSARDTAGMGHSSDRLSVQTLLDRAATVTWPKPRPQSSG